MKPGDVVIFYRTVDEMAATSIGVVECYEVHNDAAKIMQVVRRRTVYSQKDIELMAHTPTKVILFRLVGHFPEPVALSSLISEGIVSGPPQSITKISDDSFSKLFSISNW
ncbi:hypothetical protein ACQ4WP_23665 [Janthinobacterium sp. GB4P2]|uniref:hypothetical protein n=1 Tax=Janthinobacterium sp. GB4P2 TaxID=3424189 RepID=UPI003F234D9F